MKEAAASRAYLQLVHSARSAAEALEGLLQTMNGLISLEKTWDVSSCQSRTFSFTQWEKNRAIMVSAGPISYIN